MAAKIIAIVDSGSDRGVILVLSADLEELLGLIIRASCVSEREAEKILDFRGPAGGFDLKIRLCKAFALIHLDEVDCLNAVRKIRNCAAHFDDDRSFSVLLDSDQTIGFVENLAKSQNVVFPSRNPEVVRDMFILSVRSLATKPDFRHFEPTRPQPSKTFKQNANEIRQRLKGTQLGEMAVAAEAEIKVGPGD